jgi:hypothetical protein
MQKIKADENLTEIYAAPRLDASNSPQIHSEMLKQRGVWQKTLGDHYAAYCFQVFCRGSIQVRRTAWLLAKNVHWTFS